jgi:hypothetical protein
LHGPLTTTSAHRLIIKSISGLRWLFTNNRALCATYQLQQSNVSSYLSSSKSIMLLVGTNSIRSSRTPIIIDQIENLIHLLRHLHPHLNSKDSINIVATFPCLKTSTFCRSYSSLTDNILLYNTQLLALSTILNFTVVNLGLEQHHLSPDNIHISCQHQHLVQDGIFNYFHQLIPISISLSTPPVNRRSNEAVHRRQKHRLERRADVFKRFFIKRSIIPPWNIQSVKTFLQQQHIKFAKVPPIHNNTLWIQFRNTASLEAANNQLPHNIFSKDTFSRCFS